MSPSPPQSSSPSPSLLPVSSTSSSTLSASSSSSSSSTYLPLSFRERLVVAPSPNNDVLSLSGHERGPVIRSSPNDVPTTPTELVDVPVPSSSRRIPWFEVTEPSPLHSPLDANVWRPGSLEQMSSFLICQGSAIWLLALLLVQLNQLDDDEDLEVDSARIWISAVFASLTVAGLLELWVDMRVLKGRDRLAAHGIYGTLGIHLNLFQAFLFIGGAGMQAFGSMKMIQDVASCELEPSNTLCWQSYRLHAYCNFYGILLWDIAAILVLWVFRSSAGPSCWFCCKRSLSINRYLFGHIAFAMGGFFLTWTGAVQMDYQRLLNDDIVPITRLVGVALLFLGDVGNVLLDCQNPPPPQRTAPPHADDPLSAAAAAGTVLTPPPPPQAQLVEAIQLPSTQPSHDPPAEQEEYDEETATSPV